MKRENVTPDALEAHIAEANDAFEKTEGKVHEKGKYAGQMKGEFLSLKKRIEKTEDLLLVYRAYEVALAAARRYDFEDLILEAVRALEGNAEFRLEVQESLLYILADEHQDANAPRTRSSSSFRASMSGRISSSSATRSRRSIASRGADLDNVHYFRSKFPGTKILALVENYRSTQSILDTALSLIAASPDERLSRAALIAHSAAAERPISRVACATAEEEMATLARNIEAALEAGTAPGEIAVLVRRNKDVAEAARALARAGIASTGAGDEDALQNRFVRALLRLLRAIAEPHDTNLAGVLALPGFPLPAADVARISQHAPQGAPDHSFHTGRPARSRGGEGSGAGECPEARRRARGAFRMASFDRPVAVAERALQHSGLLQKVLGADDRAEGLAAIRGLLLAFEDLSRPRA